MNPNLEFSFSPLHEIIQSLSLFLHKKMAKNTDLGANWLKEAEQKLSAEFLSYLENTKLPCLEDLYLLVWQFEQKNSPEEFIQWLGSLSPGDLYEKLCFLIDSPVSNDLGAIAGQFVYMLKHWNEQYFSKLDKSLLDILEAEKERIRCEYSENPLEFVERMAGIRIPPGISAERIVMIPSYHLAPLVDYVKFKNVIFIIYPVDLPQNEKWAPPKSLVRLTKALSDENRLKILKYLSEESKSFTEILNFIGLSKSTTHHHISNLKSAGLVSTVINEDCCQESLALNPYGLIHLQKLLGEYFSL